jgi:hypothetical protein
MRPDKGSSLGSNYAQVICPTSEEPAPNCASSLHARATTALRRKFDFSSRFNAITRVQTSREKYSSFFFSEVDDDAVSRLT